MAYVVEPLLGTLKDGIFEGLATGHLHRWGGVIRISKGFPGAGQICAHLKDVLPHAVKVANPLSVVDTASSVLANVQLHQISATLGQVMQLTQVAAAASVLNLGVSAIGFLVVNHKLNRLQESVSRMEAVLRDMRSDMNRRLSDIDERLVEIRYLATVNLSLAEEAVSALAAIRAELFNEKWATVLSWSNRLERAATRDDRLLDEAIHAFDQVRLSLQASLGARALGAGSEPSWAEELMRYRLWCATSTAEILAMRRAEQAVHASRLAKEVAGKSRSLATTWQAALMPKSELGGVFRLGHSRFENSEPVLLETRRRLARMQLSSEMTDAELLLSSSGGAREVAYAEPSLSPDWFARQRSAAAVLDFVEEATERLESAAEEMAFCERRRLGFDQWEALPLPGGEEELALVRLERRAA